MTNRTTAKERAAEGGRDAVEAALRKGDQGFSWHELYPFQPKGMTVAGCRCHFVDEFTGGEPAATLLFVHGNPTWSFHWRRLIDAWRPAYRCIAVDHLGSGFSERPAKPLRLADHIDHLVEFVEKLDLCDVTLVAQDWGGAIGLGAFLRRRDRFSRIVLFNTGAFRPWFIPWRIRVCRAPVLGRLALQGGNLFARAALRMTLARSKRLDATVRAGCLAPYRDWTTRRGVYDFVRDIPASPRHPTWQTLETIESGLPSLGEVPILLVWGMKDWCFTPACLDKFCELWPHAEVHRLADVGHWVVEDAPEEALCRVGDFLKRTDGAASRKSSDRETSTDFAKERDDGPSPGTPRSDMEAAYLACAVEATATKPGNVHPRAAFVDLSYDTMLRSAAAIAPALAEARHFGVGRTILRAVQAMREAAATNAHLGAILLLAPLAYVDDGQSHRDRVRDVLAFLGEEDTRCVYEAIRLARPGGLGGSDEADVREDPPRLPLVEVMRIAADRDLVARQFVTGFATVFEDVSAPLILHVERGWDLLDAIVYAHVSLIARHGDSLIERKCGRAVADEARTRAGQVLAAAGAGTSAPFASPAFQTQLADFDRWLRADGNRRNPGTTADLIAAGLFVLLREGRLDPAAARAAIAAAKCVALPNQAPS